MFSDVQKELLELARKTTLSVYYRLEAYRLYLASQTTTPLEAVSARKK